MSETTTTSLQHFLAIDDLSRAQLNALLDRAASYVVAPGAQPARGATLRGRTVANVFFEASTRTRASFQLAAQRLGADVLNFDVARSSRSKGESDIDTLHTLAAMGVSMFVVRTGLAGQPATLAAELGPHCALINAGEAELAHPSQGLLDVFTIRAHRPDAEALRVVIVGDIAHSRVARSAVRGLRLLGVRDIRLIGPSAFLPDAREFPDCQLLTNLDEGLIDADVVMALRIQRERMAQSEVPDSGDYFEHYGLNEARMAIARPNALVMHPGPINRGIEIDDALADGPRSLIREQVKNGVAVRMALLETLAASLDRESATS